MNGSGGIPKYDCERGAQFARLVKISNSDSDRNDERNLIFALNWSDGGWLESRAQMTMLDDAMNFISKSVMA